MRISKCQFVAVSAAVLFGGLAGCNSSEEDSSVVHRAEALTTGDVWSMDNAARWTIATGSGNKQSSSVHDEGSASLQLTASAFVAVKGDAVVKPSAVSPLLAVDVMLPTQAGPFYFGAVQISVTVPSLNIFSAFVGQRDLTPPLGTWQTLQFQIPGDVYAKLLASSFSDLSVTIGLNPALNQPYRLDNLRFVPSPGCVGVPDGTSCDDGTSCTTGSTCTGGVCGAVTTTPPGSACDAADDVMGFENIPAWQPTANSAALGASTTHVQGARSLSVTTQNFVTVGSIPLATLHKVGSTLSLRVQKPTNQPNPSWQGDITLNMTVPSLGIQFSSNKPLTGQPNGTFFELQFQVPANVVQLLATKTYSDLRFSVSINPPSGQSGFYLLDDLHFLPVPSCNGVADNTACEDGSLCTQGDACHGGVCGAPTVCNDGNVCTDDTCNPATGCVFTNNTASCDDHNACTGGDRCSAGSCVPGPAVSCDDGSNCTQDSCDPATGCVHNALCPASMCVNNACCVPKTCADLHAECGVHDDGCGGTVDCSAICPAGGTCNPAGRCLPPNNFTEKTGINICQVLLEDLLIPAVTHIELSCGDFSFLECAGFTAAGHPCCVPVACDLDPVCLVSRVVVDHPEILLHPGDTYCAFRSPEEYLELLLNSALNGLAEYEDFLLTGGLSELIRFHVAIMSTAGSHIPDNARQIIRDFTAPIYNGGATGFSYDDLDGVKVISSDYPTAGFYLPGNERAAITLGPVIVLKAMFYDALFSGANSGITSAQLLTDPSVCDRYIAAIDILTHELVHVRQYANLGQFNFWDQYLGSALANGYGGIGFERDAFDYQIRVSGLQGGQLCSVMEKTEDDQISGFGLSTPSNGCPSTGIGMFDFPACP